MEEDYKSYTFQVTDDAAGIRLDSFLSGQLPELSRQLVKKQITEGRVSVNGKRGKPGYKVQALDQVCLQLPPVREPEILPEDIPLDIIYEDEDVIVINKPKRMVVHPAPGHYSGTVVNALMFHCRDSLSGINGVLRPGIVHRIDQDTTGAIIACKNDMAHQHIAAQLKEHTITRAYRAIVWNHIKEDGTVDAPIGRHPMERKKMAVHVKGAREAVTHYHVLEELKKGFTYVECRLETGRTHQIRVHMASIGHPVLGDEVYGPSKSPFKLTGQVLHAYTLGFIHPRTGEYMEFHAPLPEYFTDLLQKLSIH